MQPVGGAEGTLQRDPPVGLLVETDVSSVGSEADANALESRSRAVLRRDSWFRRSLAAADMAAVTVGLVLSAAILGNDRLMLAALAVPLLFVGVAKVMGLYDRDEHLLHRTTLDELPSLFALATTSTLLLWLADGLVVDGALARRQILGTWLLLFLLLVTLRALARWWAGATSSVERVLFVGDARGAEVLREKLASSSAVNAELVGWLPVQARRKDDPHRDGGSLLDRVRHVVAVRGVERVILGPGSSEEMMDAIRQIKGHGVKVSVMPDVARVVNSSVALDRLSGITLLGVRGFEITTSSRAIKRSTDIVGSVVALTLAAPVMLGAMLAIKLDLTGAGVVPTGASRAPRRDLPHAEVPKHGRRCRAAAG